MAIYFKNSIIEESYNCILISIYFGLIYDKFNKDIKQTLIYISSKFNCLESFENLFKKEHNLYNFNFHNQK